jgi:uracil-DNA glycosylase family 4
VNAPHQLALLRKACIECRACPLREGAVAEVTPVFGRCASSPTPCGGALAYETMAGVFRVHKGGVYRFRCPKCGNEGTNDGEARTCDAGAAGPNPADIRLVIVGEAPGPQENKIGRPFIGPAGEVLESLMKQAGIDTGKVWITNAVACWPHEEGKSGRASTVPPPASGLATCMPLHMQPQLDAFPGAMVVLALGMNAANATIRAARHQPFTRLQPLLAFRPGEAAVQRSRTHEGPAGHRVFVTYHPSYLARRGYKAGERAEAHEDAAVVLRALVAAGELAGAGR